jgi:hypothetical protein
MFAKYPLTVLIAFGLRTSFPGEGRCPMKKPVRRGVRANK